MARMNARPNVLRNSRTSIVRRNSNSEEKPEYCILLQVIPIHTDSWRLMRRSHVEIVMNATDERSLHGDEQGRKNWIIETGHEMFHEFCHPFM